MLPAPVRFALVLVAAAAVAIGTAQAQQQPGLDAHNAFRMRHFAANLTWDAGLAAQAQQWADGCSVAEDLSNNYGQNLASGQGDVSARVAQWYAEVSAYNFGAPPRTDAQYNDAYGHFTQLVWRSTARLGCAYASCAGTGAQQYWVCFYDPPGNFLGQFDCNVLPAGSTALPAGLDCSSSGGSAAGANRIIDLSKYGIFATIGIIVVVGICCSFLLDKRQWCIHTKYHFNMIRASLFGGTKPERPASMMLGEAAHNFDGSIAEGDESGMDGGEEQMLRLSHMEPKPLEAEDDATLGALASATNLGSSDGGGTEHFAEVDVESAARRPDGDSGLSEVVRSRTATNSTLPPPPDEAPPSEEEEEEVEEVEEEEEEESD